jgi:protease-4
MRLGRILCAAALAAAALPALAQLQNATDLARGFPVGLPVPATTAGAEEPTAVGVNPAGVGFVGGATLQYFFEDGQAASLIGNGLYAALPIGPLVPALALEWMSPGPGGGPRYLKTDLALALRLGQVISAGYAFNFYSSPDPSLDGLFTMDAGLTVRPLRQLSLAASVMGFGGRVGGQPLPVRYDFGAAGRFLGDSLTVSADLFANDQGHVFRVVNGAVSLQLELACGFGLFAQYLFPMRSGAAGPDGAQALQVALSYNLPHVGVTVAGDGVGGSLHGTNASSMLYGIRLSSQRYRGRLPLHTVQVVDLAAELKRPSALAIVLGADTDRYGRLLRRLQEVRDDPTITGLVVRIGSLPVRGGRIDELRATLLAIRARKPVLAYLVGGETQEYLLATGASEVVATPGSIVTVNGYASTPFFLQEGLAKLGVAFEAVAAGRYKTAPDALTRAGPGPAEREVQASLLDDRYARLVKTVASARSLPEGRVRDLVDVGVFSAEEARGEGLLDAVLWPDEVEARARFLAGGAVLAGSLDESKPRSAQRWGPRSTVAVVRVEGIIAPGKSRVDPLTGIAVAGADTLAPLLARLGEDSSVKAIVVRVESPGGDAFASDLLWRALREAARRGKPVVASMGDVAASGGYLVAAAADAVVAEPSTLTGSIGVFALKPDLSGLLQKLGVNLAPDQRGANARIASMVKPWSPAERSLVERQVGTFYDQFVAKVAECRRLTPEEVGEVAQGRVWSGEQAYQRRLVDRLGTLADAVALAETRAGLSPGEAEVWRVEPASGGLLEGFAAGVEALSAEGSALRAITARVPEIRAAAVLSELGTVLALPTPWVAVGGEP